MQGAHDNTSGGQRPQPKSRRWYGYIDVVTPPSHPTSESMPQRRPQGVSERVAPPALNKLPIRASSPDEEPVRPVAQPPEPRTMPQANTGASTFNRKQSAPRLRVRVIILYVLAGVLFVIGGLIAWQGYSANQLVEQQIEETNEATNDDGSRPATTPVEESAVDNYVVAPNLPRVLTIDKIGVKARIMPLGVTTSNQLKAPNNVHDVGWYNASAQPGQPGAMLMDGHVSSWTSDGVFKNLKNLVPGDVVTVERGDGQKLQFRVVRSQAYEESATDMRAALAPVTEGKNGLNLITCYGRVKPGTSEFEQRLIVFAEQI